MAWNYWCPRNWPDQSSMEFHGTARVNEIGALQFPWNSFHGTVCVIKIGPNQVPRKSTEFHGTARVNEIGTLQVPWNSMELLVSSKLAHSIIHGIWWNSMELLVSAKLTDSKLYGIPWIWSCQRNWRTRNSMEFLGFLWNCSCKRNWRTPSSMEFHEIFFYYSLIEPIVSSLIWVLNLDRIPWNLSFPIFMTIIFNFDELINFRKLISTLYRSLCLFYQLMFYFQYLNYTRCISGITKYVSSYHWKSLFNAHWNLFWSKSSMELSPEFHGAFWTTFEQHLWFHGIPWNLSNKISSSMEFHGNLSRSQVLWNSTILFPYSRVPWNSMEFNQ